jgi:hypothetical protein
MIVGDRVRLIGIPPDVEDLPTKLTFQKCLGHEFTVTAINKIGYAELQIESITGTSDDKIYVSPRFLKISPR